MLGLERTSCSDSGRFCVLCESRLQDSAAPQKAGLSAPGVPCLGPACFSGSADLSSFLASARWQSARVRSGRLPSSVGPCLGGPPGRNPPLRRSCRESHKGGLGSTLSWNPGDQGARVGLNVLWLLFHLSILKSDTYFLYWQEWNLGLVGLSIHLDIHQRWLIF